MNKKIIPIYSWFIFFPISVFCASLTGTADRMGQELMRIGISLGVAALVLGGIYLSLGKQDGNEKITKAIIGLLVVILAPAIVKLIKTLI